MVAAASHGYAEIYVNKETLFTYTVQHNLKALPAYLGLSAMYLANGQISEALSHAEEAVRLAPNSEMAHRNLGGVFFKMADRAVLVAVDDKALVRRQREKRQHVAARQRRHERRLGVDQLRVTEILRRG